MVVAAASTPPPDKSVDIERSKTARSMRSSYFVMRRRRTRLARPPKAPTIASITADGSGTLDDDPDEAVAPKPESPELLPASDRLVELCPPAPNGPSPLSEPAIDNPLDEARGLPEASEAAIVTIATLEAELPLIKRAF